MPDDPKPSLLEQLNTRFAKLRLLDVTIRRFERKIAFAQDQVRAARQQIAIGYTAIHSQEKFLKKRAAEQIRAEAGVKTIPGFGAAQETMTEFRRRMKEKEEEIRRKAIAALDSPKASVP